MTPATEENVVDGGLTEYTFDMPDQVTGGTVTFRAAGIAEEVWAAWIRIGPLT